MAEESLVNLEGDGFHATPPSPHSDIDINPNQRLSSVLLNEFNYLPWERAVSLALGGRSKLGYVNGAIPMPETTSPEYDAWLCKDQLVMSCLLNSMDHKIAEIFSYAESSMTLWKNLKEMYGNQNNAARVFQLKKDIAGLQQEGKPFVQHLGKLTIMWNELNVYRPHTIDAAVLTKRAEEHKIFQLLASLSPEFEDLRSHILMNPDLPSFSSVCATIQREEVRRKVMTLDMKANIPEARAYFSNQKFGEERGYKGKKTGLKCSHCDAGGHSRDRCWILHPELKPKFPRDNKGVSKGSYNPSYKANHVATTSFDGALKFTTNPAALINEFAMFLHKKQGLGDSEGPLNQCDNNQTALLGQFAGFLAGNEGVVQRDIPGILHSFSTALNIGNVHDYWIIDSGATDHITNKSTNLHKFEKFSIPSQVSVANGKNAMVVGKGKIHLISSDVENEALYVPSFPFQLLSVSKITNSLNCLAIFSPKNVIFQDVVTKKTIGEGFFLNEDATCTPSDHVPDDVNLHSVEHLEDENPSSSEIHIAPSSDPSNHDVVQIPVVQSPTVRRNPARERKLPSKLHDYVTYTARYPVTDVIDYSKVSSSFATFLSAINEAREPQSFQEANLHSEWRNAMAEELQALHENNTWTIVKLPKGKKAVGSRWVYKTKFHSDGTIERNKARLVARGFTQTYDVDYKETFAPVAKMNTVRVLLSVAINNAWPLFQMDVKNAFLHGDNMSEINALKQYLNNKFAIKDLGTLKYFLGIKMAHSHKGFFLNQRKYVMDLLHEAKMTDCKPARTPLDSNLKLKTHGDPVPNLSYYQRMVGKLIYLTITRPDISYAVSIVSQFMHSPSMDHLKIVHRVLRYLKGSIGRGILMRNNSHTQISGYTDADWADNFLDRKSTTGFCTFVGGNLVTWKRKKQSVVARSSAEAEYRAMTFTACELIWLKSLLLT
ncbi:uncharacterized protein [Pyrus communis]|uniref:uncharacterized protein n=1 Tax=Pyrus communis TaxID=23211 RepID=UPI0035BEF85E